jgi:hypothetical protein
VFGVTLGVVAIWVYTRMRQKAADDNPDTLAERIAERLKELETTAQTDA